MSLVHIGNMGGQNYRAEVELAAVNVTKDTVLYGASGYATNASAAAIYTNTVIGVVQQSVDNSGGSAGDKSAIIEMSPLALYEADCSGTMSAALRWTNVTLDTVATVDEDDAQTGKAGVIKLREMISASKALVSINYASPTEA